MVGWLVVVVRKQKPRVQKKPENEAKQAKNPKPKSEDQSQKVDVDC